MATTAKQPHQPDQPAIRVDDDPASPYYVPPIRWLTLEEGRALFDERARELMGMSGEEFLRRWDAGEFDALFDTPGNQNLTDLALLIPFARQNAG